MSDVTSEVEGQIVRWSDETLKQAIKQLEDALAALSKLEAKRKQAEVEGRPSPAASRTRP